MASFLPIKLVGDNLGKRHHQLNDIVLKAFNQKVPLDSILIIEEQTPIDRLFKIDLASKYKNVDYIVENLKHDEILYVSRALKSIWLLEEEYVSIINPKYLDDVLYPEMTLTAVNKMKNWIHQHLKDTKRCEDFYKFYFEKDIHTAIRFLWLCSNEFMLQNFVNIVDKIKPTQLKIFTEKCPAVATVFFDSLRTNKKLLAKYKSDSRAYFTSLKTLLKLDANIYLDIIEKYYNIYNGKKLSKEASKFIIQNHRERFDKKPELYTVFLLDVQTLANGLNETEIKELIIKLARAEYIRNWFEYKSIEPLIKALKKEEIPSFKKKIFVDKDFGEKVEKWPYEIPEVHFDDDEHTIFDDDENNPEDYLNLDDSLIEPRNFRMMLKKRKCAKYRGCRNDDLCMAYAMGASCPRKTSLDNLFDTYRFSNFEKTYDELIKKIATAGSQHRQYMMLVLVSKTGGKIENLEKLLKLLVKHENEPDNLRATVIRSLVKRSSVWRVSQSTWDLLLTFGHDIGLDGKPTSVPCNEGIHAVVLRSILAGESINPAVWDMYVKNFSNFKEYALNKKEKEEVRSKLPDFLLSAAERLLKSDIQKDVCQGIENLGLMIDVITTYRLKFDNPRFAQVISEAVLKDKSANQLLERLFKLKINRKQMFKENFAVIQSNASYFNVLKHDISVLKSGKEFETLVEKGTLHHDLFFHKLALYFNEENGLASQYLTILEKAAEKIAKKEYAKPIAILAGSRLESIIRHYDKAEKYSAAKKLAGFLKSNAHLPRPLLNLDSVDWRWLGAKAVANRKLKSSTKSIPGSIEKLLSWNRTHKLAVLLSMRAGMEVKVLTKLAERRPKFTLKVVSTHYSPNKMNPKIWDVVIPTIAKIDMSKMKKPVINALVLVEVPNDLKSNYYTVLYNSLKGNSQLRFQACAALCHLENIMLNEESGIEDILVDYLQNGLKAEYLKFSAEMVSSNFYERKQCSNLYVRIIAKYLLRSKNEKELKQRFDKVAEPFLNSLEELGKEIPSDTDDVKTLKELEEASVNTFIEALKWNKLFQKTETNMCMTIIEKIVERMQKTWPIVSHFDKYVNLHLTMLFFKAVKQGALKNKEIFEKLPQTADSASDIIGVILGKYVAQELMQLTTKYFDSVKHLYKKCLLDYLESLGSNKTKNIFIQSFVKGVMSNENENTHLIAENIVHNYYSFDEKLRKETKEKLEKSKDPELSFFYYAKLFE